VSATLDRRLTPLDRHSFRVFYQLLGRELGGPASAACAGVPNLSIAGASVYPTAGCANPTLTLVALSLRLSDHLKTSLA